MTTNSIILQLCDRLRSNDPNLSSLSLSSLPLFEIAATDIDLILGALVENQSVTELSFSLPDDIQDGNTASLLKQYLGCSHCLLESLSLSSLAMSSWQGLCDALKLNTSVKTLEIGTPASVLVTEHLDSLNQLACQQFADALATSEVDCLTLRRFHIESSEWPCFLKGLKTTKRLELHQIVSDTSFFDSLVGVSENLQELSIIQCSSKTSSDTLLRAVSENSCILHLEKLRIAECNSCEFATALCRFGSMDILKELDLRDNAMSDHIASTLAEWLTQQPSLENLILEGCDLSGAACSSILNALGQHQGITQLDVRRNHLNGDSSSVLKLPPNLKVLDLSENKGLGESSWLPSLVENNPHVVEWNLATINMTDKGLTDVCMAIDRHGETCKIKVLDLGQTTVGIKGLAALSFVLEKRLTSLKKINLTSCGLDDEAISNLARSMKNHKSLIEVSLSYNPFGNTACHVLAETASTMPSLRSLGISFARYDNEGLGYFVSALRDNPRLENMTYWTYASFRGEMDEVEGQVDRWLLLNRAGRRVIHETIELNLFSIVLERARRRGGQQGLYYILRESVHLCESS